MISSTMTCQSCLKNHHSSIILSHCTFFTNRDEDDILTAVNSVLDSVFSFFSLLDLQLFLRLAQHTLVIDHDVTQVLCHFCYIIDWSIPLRVWSCSDAYLCYSNDTISSHSLKVMSMCYVTDKVAQNMESNTAVTRTDCF